MTTMAKDSDFRPALVVVDLQNDFCPPDGPLAISGGREISSSINKLLALPFTLKVATKDWHPRDHVSFASNHDPPNNKPFESTYEITNPLNPEEKETTRLWPDHCIQGTRGAELIDELDKTHIDHIVEKGQDARVEMYSAFSDPFPTHAARSGLAQTLKDAGITHVYVVGLAQDYCCKYTAIDAAKEGFTTYMVEEAVKGVDQSAFDAVKRETQEKSVEYIKLDSDEVERVKGL